MADDIPSRVAVLEQIAREVRDGLLRIDQRLDRIEDKIDKLNSRIWTNFYWMLGAFAALLGVMAHGFRWL
jgi:hypothetical protein